MENTNNDEISLPENQNNVEKVEKTEDNIVQKEIFDELPDVVDLDKIKLEERSKEMRRFAILAKIAYDYYDKNNDDKAVTEELHKFLPRHDILPEYSDDNSVVISKVKNDGSKDVIISYRGTRPDNPNDLIADGQVLLGLPSERLANVPLLRFREAEQKYLKVKENFPDANITLTGHSLGSSQGLYVAKKYDLPAHLFDVGSSPADLVFNQTNNKNVVDIYYVAGDIISTSNRFLNKNDRLHKIEHPTWLSQMAGSGISIASGALVCGLPCAIAGGTLSTVYNQFISNNSFHSLANYLPKNVFPYDEIVSNVKNEEEYTLKEKPFSTWLYPKITKVPINPGRTYNNDFCFNPRDKKCKNYVI